MAQFGIHHPPQLRSQAGCLIMRSLGVQYSPTGIVRLQADLNSTNFVGGTIAVHVVMFVAVHVQRLEWSYRFPMESLFVCAVAVSRGCRG